MGSGSKAFSKSLAAYAFASEPLPANDNYLAVLSCGGEGDEPFQNLTHNPVDAADILKTRFVTTTKNSGYTLGYTNAHQLASEVYSNSTYDFGPPSTTGTASYTAANVLNQYPGVTPLGGTAQSLTYDANANLTFDGVLTYTYNPQNRLMLVQNGTTQVATYVYDGVDRRVTKTVGSTVTNFLQDGDDEIAEYDGSVDVLRRFVPGRAINEPIAFETCPGSSNPSCSTISSTTFFATDHHGSVVAMSESNGNPATGGTDGPFTYDAYGVSPSTMTGVPFRYVGMYYDAETGLYYDRARYYCPACGRFMQTDPIGYKDDMDLYSYAANDPIDRDDPTGKYGRGTGFSDKQWATFSTAQNHSIQTYRDAIKTLQSLDDSLKSGKGTGGFFSSTHAMANRMESYWGAGSVTVKNVEALISRDQSILRGEESSTQKANIKDQPADKPMAAAGADPTKAPGTDMEVYPRYFKDDLNSPGEAERARIEGHESDHGENGEHDQKNSDGATVYGQNLAQGLANANPTAAQQNPDNQTYINFPGSVQ